MSGSRVGVVWMEVSGGIVRAKVVSRVAVKVVWMVLKGWEVFERWFWMGDLSLEEMSMKSVRGIFFEGFWFEEFALEAMEINDTMRISVFIIRIGGIGVEMIGMVQGQQCVRERKVFRFNEFGIHKSEVVEKTSTPEMGSSRSPSEMRKATRKRVSNNALEKVKALGACGVISGSRVGVVWMEVGGGIVRARVVSRVAVEELAFEAMEYDDRGMEGSLQSHHPFAFDPHGGLNSNEEVDDYGEEVREVRPIGRDRAKKKASSSSRF
ncbi:hypothetical protein Tco_0639684 [Tanacetum coccineum]